jgi:peptide/nickel transport system ATP-binding protein
MIEPVVAVRNLTVEYKIGATRRRVVDGIDLTIHPGESFGLVGESGSGKSTIALALTRFLPANGTVGADQFVVAGEHVLSLDASGLRQYRASKVGVVYQEPALALNPTSTVGAQIAEVFRTRGASRAAARASSIEAVESVGLPNPVRIVNRYPHELSGGQQQRVVIAMALASKPRLLILDEATTGLDSKVESDILALIERLQQEHHFATLLISHNLPLVASHCDRVGVLKDGELVEQAEARTVLTQPTHLYTKALVAAVPDIHAPREPTSVGGRAPLVELRGVTKRIGQKLILDTVSLTIGAGEVVGLVGESGSGKTTLGRVVAGLVSHEGALDIHRPAGSPSPTVPPVQMVFQSPDASLNPRRTVRQVLSRSIHLLGGDTDAATLAESAGLPFNVLDRYPRELSGGQKQRVAIARAFAGPVPLVICDEVTSALDVSVQARILDLLASLRESTGVAYLFISHDLAVVRSIADRVVVLNQGRIVEHGDTDDVFSAPRSEYTGELIAAATGLRTALA